MKIPAPRAFPRSRVAALRLLAAGLLSVCLLSACRGAPVFVAERSAPVGNEFIRLFPDGHAEYGYQVVKENLKAQGAYRFARDTVWFDDASFKAHFPEGFLAIEGDVLFMGNGLHFKIKTDKLRAH